jgi:hypothetical protein
VLLPQLYNLLFQQAAQELFADSFGMQCHSLIVFADVVAAW